MQVPNQYPWRVPPDQQNDLTMRYVDRRFDDKEDIAGPAICKRCHAYLETDHWLYSEKRRRELQERPDVTVTLCPGCSRVERRLYEGEVRIYHGGNEALKQELLNLIHHEEARARIHNPMARIALLEERGDEIYLLTTTEFLAKRIGQELRKAHRGVLKLNRLPRERFMRVTWNNAA